MNFVKTYGIGMLLMLFISCGSLPRDTALPAKREFRAVWVATVVNIDWPKSGDDPVEKQQKDFIALLDFYKKLHFNAVIVQVRTAGDALYPSEKAPWSRFLTGKEGRAPKPYYDPLQWMIETAHERGFEFHAWLNPYRATFDLNTKVLSTEHDYFKHPEWMVKYGKKYYYNPGLPEVRTHLLSIIEEVIENYNVDAIHFDDYFYPYKIRGAVFDDAEAYNRYGQANQTIDDWRRANVDLLIEGIHDIIKAQKPWVQFGISPFGVWRNVDKDPKGSDTQAGQTTYDDLYADPMMWMEQGWIDYLVPQLYWSMEHPKVSHRKLVHWWSKQVKNTNLYIGNGAYKVGSDRDTAWHKRDELSNQIVLARNTARVMGNVFFSAKSLLHPDHKALVTLLSDTLYKYKVLPPVSRNAAKPYLDHRPKLLSVKKQNGMFRILLQKEAAAQIRHVVLYGYTESGKRNREDSRTILEVFYAKSIENTVEIYIKPEQLQGKKRFVVTYLDAYGRESAPALLKLPNTALTSIDSSF